MNLEGMIAAASRHMDAECAEELARNTAQALSVFQGEDQLTKSTYVLNAIAHRMTHFGLVLRGRVAPLTVARDIVYAAEAA